ncbi:transmembrane protein 69 [Notamacropus eugenii]|uniref:transmembrane protein 69 n=1 Tax=Notamacropus eugenii TaxID=9315 RepID=UPI003B67E532
MLTWVTSPLNLSRITQTPPFPFKFRPRGRLPKEPWSPTFPEAALGTTGHWPSSHPPCFLCGAGTGSDSPRSLTAAATMLRLLRSGCRAPSQVLKAPPCAAPVSARPEPSTPCAPPFLRRPRLLASSLGFENGGKDYHTSTRCLKKKVPAVPSSPPPTLTHLRDVPKPALRAALTGLVPFAAPPLIMMTAQTYVPVLAFAQVAYGASFLSFLGGVRWGFTLPEDSPAKPDTMNLACSGAPLLFSWYAFLISEGLTEAILMVVVGFGVALHSEVFLLPRYPDWFRALRIVVTLVAFFSFVATLVIKDFYPETGPRRPPQAE